MTVQEHLRIDHLPAGEVHAIGVAGLESATMVRYLIENGRAGVVLHEESPNLGSAFEAAHRFQPAERRTRSLAALGRCQDLRSGTDYLTGVESAAAILVPVSWFLRPQRARLEPLRDRFVTYPDACFDLWQGPVVGITGTYGKTTTCRFASHLLNGPCCGNDRESLFDLSALAAGRADEHLAFELSNRHLHNGFRRRLDVGVLTGVAQNHEPDHGSFDAYRRVKYSLANTCREFLYHVGIPRAFPDAARITNRGSSYGADGDWRRGSGTVHGPAGRTAPFLASSELTGFDQENALVSIATALLCGVSCEDIERRLPGLAAAGSRHRHQLRRVAGRVVVNDSAACVPAASAALVRSLDRRFVLICGGDRQRYRPGEFDGLAQAVAANPHAALVCVIGPMGGNIAAALRAAGFHEVVSCADLVGAVERAAGVEEAAVVFSPGCGTGTQFQDKYRRGEVFDDAIAALLSGIPDGEEAS